MVSVSLGTSVNLKPSLVVVNHARIYTKTQMVSMLLMLIQLPIMMWLLAGMNKAGGW
jgi:hypothetical protein